MSTVTKAARKGLIWLAAIIVTVYGLLAVGVLTNNTTLTPGLALDLAGGRQIILSPVLEDGAEQSIEQSDLDQAVEIIRQRIDATGVAESEIATQGNNIVVSLPGTPSEATVDLVSQAAQLQFRPVLVVGDPNPTTVPEDPAIPETDPSLEPDDQLGPIAPSPSPEATAASDPTPSPTASEVAHVVTGTEATPSPSPEPTPAPSPTGEAPASVTPDRETTDASSFEWLTDDLLEVFADLDCRDPENLAGRTMGDENTGHVACAEFGVEKLAMGPVEIAGEDLVTATAGPEFTQTGTMTGGYEVRLVFNNEGAGKFDDVTRRLLPLESPRNQFAIILDGVVISHPQVNARISNGEAVITGNFTQEAAEQLANQLKFGALPLSLEVQSNQQISATLGADQLEKGLIAGAIGLVLVMIYSVLQYRALGLVTIASLLLAGGVTFGFISLLSWGLDYRLSLAGVAGLIIAIGITADSFIVLFERVRDELREGRSLSSAIDHAWRRARRTILISDAISLLAAVTLYMLAVGGVRGFAFTLGLTTVVDVIIVFLFTHPVLVLLAKTKFFGEGHRFSGLDPRQLGRESIYKGRGRVVSATSAAAIAGADSGLTLAERKAAQRKAQQEAPVGAADAGDSDREGEAK